MVLKQTLESQRVYPVFSAESGEGAAVLLHDIKSSLSIVLSGLSALDRQSLSKRDCFRIEFALEETLRIKRLLGQPLSFIKAYPASQLQFQPLEVNTFLQKIHRLVRHSPSTEGRYLQIHSELSEVWIEANQEQLKQVFFDLIQQTCEVTSKGKKIDCQVEKSSSDHGVFIRIHNRREAAPEPPIQGTKPFESTTPGYSHLDLTFAKQVIEAHNGELHFASSDTGTTVTIFLQAL